MIDAWAVLVISALVAAEVWAGFALFRSLHMLQLDSYSNARLLRWMSAAPQRLIDKPLLYGTVGLILLSIVVRTAGVPYAAQGTVGAWIVGLVTLLVLRPRTVAKKPLVYTGRALRILGLAALLCLAFAAVVGLYLLRWTDSGDPTSMLLLAVGVAGAGAPAVPLANWLLSPGQHAINRRYLDAARGRLREIAPVVIGITGSFGKTSTKHFLHTILSRKFAVLMTPASFNTLMGICRVINDNLTAQHRVFIVEMGAYGRGEIKELADFVHPSIGVVTAIGPQHLERFKTIENVMATKYELIAALPADGAAVFNDDDAMCRVLADRTQHVGVRRYGIQGPRFRPHLTVRAEDIQISSKGTVFTLADRADHRAEARVPVLGRFNVHNILAASAVAIELGMSVEEIGATLSHLEPAEHRLQVLAGAGGVTVIDDSYNANPEGAREALETLRQFATGRRVLVTPGMVELGNLQESANRAFGRQAAAVCDHVILVGPKQTRPIREGLEGAAFPAERVTTVGTLEEAAEVLQRILKPGDTVLFENDLPDLYAES